MARDGGGRFAVLFSSVAKDASADRVSYAACMLSLRDQQHVPASVQIHERCITSLEEIEAPSWGTGTLDLNYQAALEWLAASPDLTRDLVFIPLEPQLQFCLFVHQPIPESVVLAATQRGVTRMRLPLVPSNHLVFASSCPQELIGMFASPGDLGVLYHSVCIAMDATADAAHWTESEQLLLGKLLDNPHPEAMLREWEKRPSGWVYCVLMSPATYDVGDPVYCVAMSHYEQLACLLHALCSRHGYRTYDLPLSEDIIWAWLLRGEIPVLCSSPQATG